MAGPGFDYTKADAQATVVEPIAAPDFDFDAYADYEQERSERCQAFWKADQGVLVYRRMRVAEVFSYGCRDMKQSLEWQLGALAKSMAYQADVPNFLEPWYGIGTISAAYGADYIWHEGQAPAVPITFQSVAQAMEHQVTPVADTPIGRHTLSMIDFFIEQTQGRLPMCLTDTQSPLNIAGNIVDMSNMLLELMENPDAVHQLFDQLARQLASFSQLQAQRIGDAAVWPGHGFASSRRFDGLGMSDDNAVMMSGDMYLEHVAPSVKVAGEPFGGPVFHSCGNWSRQAPSIRRIDGLRMVDAAFAPGTDPDPNPPEPFAEVFANTGLVLNARIVGDPDTVEDYVRKLWRDGMKLIVVTYCHTPEEQAEAYGRIHRICGG